MATDFAKLLQNIGVVRDEQIEQIKEGAREHAVQVLEQFFAELFTNNKKLTHVFCVGYTPEWNDGEECNHDTNILIHNDFDGWCEMYELLEHHLDWEVDYEDPSAELRRINATLNPSQCRDIEDQIPIDAMTEALGTNWLIVATRDGVEIKKYSCGY